MERELGKDLEQGKKRVAFLMDNCDAVEEKGYMKPFTPEELARMKESLSETDIEINDIEEEKTAAMKDFKARLEPLTTERKKTLDGLKKMRTAQGTRLPSWLRNLPAEETGRKESP